MSMNRKNRAPKVLIGSFVSITLFFCGVPAVRANNLNISNVSISSQDTSADTVTIQFDISWNNSWYDSDNKDAAWVFVKFSTDSGSSWGHATLSASGTNPSGFSRGSGTGIDIVVPSDKKGAFIQRSSMGSGSLSTTSVQFVWNYAADGVSDADANANKTRIRIMGLEMTYIPQGSFYLGDGTGTADFEYGGSSGARGGLVENEFQMQFGTATNQFYYNTGSNSGENSSGALFEVGLGFPKGHMAFYMMKYELTEGMWVSFFNTLTNAQKTTRDITSASGKNSDSSTNRNTVAWSSGDATTTRTDRPVSYVSWMDAAAFFDWAALRPMTELEYEKACKGPVSTADGVYAWGTSSKTDCGQVSGAEDGTETCNTSNANINVGNTNITNGDGPARGPLRSGMYATSSTVTREATGAGYYGNMELSGNLWEMAVTIGNVTGRQFRGTHGDGVLTTTSTYEGNATNSDWPGIDSVVSRGVTGATGSGRRGSGWSETTTTRAQICDRAVAAAAVSSRGSDYGIRGVRTAEA